MPVPETSPTQTHSRNRIQLARLGRIFFLILPTLGALLWSFFPAIQALNAVATFKQNKSALRAPPSQAQAFEMKRNIQKHFLNNQIYIPLEDIVVMGEDSVIDSRSRELNAKVCGDGDILIWIPLRYRLPLLGEQVHEWCYKLRIP